MGASQLNCRTTHWVHLQQQEHVENAGLYAIYGNRVGQTPSFMQEWLHYFITVVYKAHFTRKGFTYLANKGLDLELWADSMKDGHRPDFFVLFALNALLETHAVVHLKENKLWMTMNDPPDDHDTILERCEYYLVYLGRGNFVELVQREQPLITVYSDADIKTIKIGQLTFNEEKTLNSVIYRGLGRGVDSSQPKKPEGVPFSQVPIKEEEPDNVRVKVQSPAESETTATSQPNKAVVKGSTTKEKEIETILRKESVVKIKKLALYENGIIIMTDELKKMIKGRSGYDSDKTIIHNLGGLVTPDTSKVSQLRSQTTCVNTCKGNKVCQIKISYLGAWYKA